MDTLSPPQLAKRGSLTPSIRRFLDRYPPAIIDDEPRRMSTIHEPQRPQPQAPVLPAQLPRSAFDQRFPQGYKIADVSIPLHPDEVPTGYEHLFSPTYYPICRRLFWLGFLCPLLWVVGACILMYKRIQLNTLIDPKMYWTRVQWIKLNSKFGASCGMAFLVLLLIVIIVVMVVKTYIIR